MKHIFIINPLAGKGKPLKLIPYIEKLFKTRPANEYFIRIIQRPDHAISIVQEFAEYAKVNDCRIYSVGGDGTLNVVLNGIMKSGISKYVSLAAIPTGSGNDFIRSLTEIEKEAEKETEIEVGKANSATKYKDKNADKDKRSLEELLENVVYGTAKIIDAAKVNDDYYINIASLGFDGEVAHTTNKLKKYPLFSGKFSYIAGVFLTLAKCTRHAFKINVDGQTLDSEVLLIAVANGRYYGGGMKAAPQASCLDGIFDICLIKRVGRLRIIYLLPKFMKGRHASIKEVFFYKGRHVEIECASETPINIDGEVKLVRRADFEILPNAIKFVMPR